MRLIFEREHCDQLYFIVTVHAARIRSGSVADYVSPVVLFGVFVTI